MASQPQAAPPPPETIQVDSSPAACDGGGGALGHPMIYIPLADGRGECGYCDRVFVLKPGARASGH
ncbi:MAG: zinc-finger domain-containing protein [Alphaproteobacteria bacterium]|nr:zinc-finger domain-containing protein [Alphaproteobacteria bacterium]